MRSKKLAWSLSVTVFLIFALSSTKVSAQLRKHSEVKHKSYYLTAGINKSQFFNSKISISQPSLNNNYQFSNVKGANTFSFSSFSPLNINYRIGYYYNYPQTCGIEIAYDPVNYHIADNQNINVTGMVSGSSVSTSLNYSSAVGYKYSLSGGNFLLVNFVRRFTVYRPYSNNVGVDAIAKVGVGPCMPRFVSALPGNQFDAPQFRFYGAGAAGSAALRVTVKRYFYVEAEAKYDYAMYTNLPLYAGTAKQNLATLEFFGGIGFTFPSNRYNPLFHKEKKIITIIPFYQDRRDRDSMDMKAIEDEKRENGEEEKEFEVPEFNSILDKQAKFKEEVERLKADSIAEVVRLDSMAHQAVLDSIAQVEMQDSLARKAFDDSVNASLGVLKDTLAIPDSTARPEVPADDHKETKKERKARLKKEKEAAKQKEAEANGVVAPPPPPDGEAVPPPPAADGAAPPPAPAPEEQLSKKELKAKKKQEEKERKDKEKAEQDAKDKAERDAKEKADQERKAAEQKAADEKAAEEKKVEESKDQAKAEEKESKKARKAREKKEREEQKEKERQEKEKADQEAKDKAEQEKKAAEEKKDPGVN